VAVLAAPAAAGRLAAWLPADGGSGRGGAALALLGNLAEAGGEALAVEPGAPLGIAGSSVPGPAPSCVRAVQSH